MVWVVESRQMQIGLGDGFRTRLPGSLGRLIHVRPQAQRERMSRVLFKASTLILASILATLCMTPRSVVASDKRSDKQVAVFVCDAADVQPLAGAHVFIISEAGKVLSEGTTSREGLVRLRKPSLEEMPAFVLAEAQGYEISGYRWDQGYDERLIVLSRIPFA